MDRLRRLDGRPVKRKRKDVSDEDSMDDFIIHDELDEEAKYELSKIIRPRDPIENQRFEINQLIDHFGSQYGKARNTFIQGLKDGHDFGIHVLIRRRKMVCNLCDLMRTVTFRIEDKVTGRCGFIGTDCCKRLKQILRMQRCVKSSRNTTMRKV